MVSVVDRAAWQQWAAQHDRRVVRGDTEQGLLEQLARSLEPDALRATALRLEALGTQAPRDNTADADALRRRLIAATDQRLGELQLRIAIDERLTLRNLEDAVTLARVVPLARWPAVLVTQPAPAPAAELALALARAAAALPVALELRTMLGYLDTPPDSRRKAILREGLVLTRSALPPERTGTADPLEGPTNVEPGAPEPRKDSVDDDARSEAERRLYAALQSDPRTRDQFVLNDRLPHDFGGRRLEIDLHGAAASMAVEVDGYYHFTDLDAYRRDRRKDLLMQSLGLLVVRVLADDVLDDPSPALETIATHFAARTS